MHIPPPLPRAWGALLSCPNCAPPPPRFFLLFIYLFFFHLFLLAGGQSLHNIAMGFVIHWHKSAMELHIFPIPIPPPTSKTVVKYILEKEWQPTPVFFHEKSHTYKCYKLSILTTLKCTIQQKPLQYWKVISLQLIKINGKKRIK